MGAARRGDINKKSTPRARTYAARAPGARRTILRESAYVKEGPNSALWSNESGAPLRRTSFRFPCARIREDATKVMAAELIRAFLKIIRKIIL